MTKEEILKPLSASRMYTKADLFDMVFALQSELTRLKEENSMLVDKLNEI